MIRTICIVTLLVIAACSTTPSTNPTVFPYEIDREALAANPIKSVIIAHVSIGGVTRSYLQPEEARIDKKIKDYLEDNGIKVLPQRGFEQKWKKAVRIYGSPVDPTTGRMNQKAFVQSLVAVRDGLAENERPDGIVFTDLLEQETSFSGGLKHLARWHGVTRKPTLQGPGSGVSADHDWLKPVDAASLWVNIYDMELKRVFSSIGGLDTVQAIDTRSSSGRMVRRRNLLESESHIREGIQLAFHPFIVMDGYPGPDRPSVAN